VLDFMDGSNSDRNRSQSLNGSGLFAAPPAVSSRKIMVDVARNHGRPSFSTLIRIQPGVQKGACPNENVRARSLVCSNQLETSVSNSLVGK
jgi:hypothetical protein